MMYDHVVTWLSFKHWLGDRPPKVYQTLRGLSFSASAARALAFLPTSFRPYPLSGNLGDGQLPKSYAFGDQMSKFAMR